MNNQFKTLALFVLTAFLSGCQNLSTISDHFSCSAEHCLRSYPATDVDENSYWNYDDIIILPPQLGMEERTLDGEVTGSTTVDGYGQELLLNELNRISDAYQVHNRPLPTPNELLPAVNQLYHNAWSDSPDPEQIRKETPFFGLPELPDPVKNREIEIPESLQALGNETCCVLITRFTGWHHTTGAKAAKITSAAILGAMAGGSGVPGSFGSAVSDMAVIRITDGKVIWSARLISNGHPQQLKKTAIDFYGRVYQAKIHKQYAQ